MVSIASGESPLRVGIIGTGFLGTALGREFSRHDDGSVVALTDVSEENLEAAGNELDVPESARYDDHEVMVAEESLDAIVITTPHAFHAEQILLGLENDLHVLCEKPMCTDLADAREIVERAEASDRTVMLGYQRHLDSAFIAAREFWVENGRTPQFVTAEVTQDWINAVQGSWKSDPDLSGGGQLYDTGSHLVDAVLWTTGLTPSAVTGDMVFHEDGVDIHASVSVTFEEDAVATIAVSGDTPRVSESLRIWGDEGATYVEGREWDDRTYREVDTDGHIQNPNIGRGTVQSKAEAFIEAIENGTEPPATVQDGLASTAVTEAAYEAARRGERVDIDL